LKNDLIVIGYIALFAGSVMAMTWWQRRQRKTRLPFGEELRLLRSPGETQLAYVRKCDEDGFMWMVLACLLPVTIGWILLYATTKLPGTLQLGGLGVTIVGFVGSFILAARWFTERAREYHNRYLGYFGERIVAEHLDPLKQTGWRVFHDVPAQNNGTKFNVDHVAVGPQGVFVIETKTRRKGGARPGFDDHKVYFDGRSLVWPWGEDNHGLEQAERTSVWLANTLKDELGERVYVTPILTLPGWWVEMKPSRDSRVCRVTNPKGLTKFLPNGSAILTPQQVNNIAVKLEARCRDVEY
jgi:hypothetical protein